MDKIMEAIMELRTKGSLQEQAEKLYSKEKLYKKLISTYNDRIDEIDEEIDEYLFVELWKMKEKYKIRLENIKTEMCYLNKRIIDNMKVFDELIEIKTMEVETFLDTFNLDWDEYDEEEDCYTNLLRSNTPISHVCRQGLIQNEKILQDMMKEDESTKEEDEIYNEMRDNY